MPLADILGITIGIPGFIVGLAVVLRFMLKKRELEMRGRDPELGRVVEALSDDLDDTRAQLADIQERLDIAERKLPAGSAPQED